MDVTPLVPPDQKVIQSYAKGAFRINGEVYTTPVLVGAGFVRPWPGFSAGGLPDPADFTGLQGHIDVVLIGSGATTGLLPPVLRQSFREKGLLVEMMDTGAACRTYNVLSAEGRRVAAALLPV